MFQLHNSYGSRVTESKIARRGTLLHRSRTVSFQGVRVRPNRPFSLTSSQLQRWANDIRALEQRGLVFLQWKNKPILVEDALALLSNAAYILPRQSTLPILSSSEPGATHAKRIFVPPQPRPSALPVAEDSSILALPTNEPVVVLSTSLPAPQMDTVDEFPDPPTLDESPPSDFTVSFKDAALRVGIQMRQLKKRIKHWNIPTENECVREVDLLELTKEPPATK